MRNKQMTVSDDILFYAFRYALGRKTHAPSTVSESIQANLPQMEAAEIRAYVREIEERSDLGMAMDQRIWLDLRNELVRELNQRNSK